MTPSESLDDDRYERCDGIEQLRMIAKRPSCFVARPDGENAVSASGCNERKISGRLEEARSAIVDSCEASAAVVMSSHAGTVADAAIKVPLGSRLKTAESTAKAFRRKVLVTPWSSTNVTAPASSLAIW
jgi:hypothetical protein